MEVERFTTKNLANYSHRSVQFLYARGKQIKCIRVKGRKEGGLIKTSALQLLSFLGSFKLILLSPWKYCRIGSRLGKEKGIKLGRRFFFSAMKFIDQPENPIGTFPKSQQCILFAITPMNRPPRKKKSGEWNNNFPENSQNKYFSLHIDEPNQPVALS